MMRLRDMPGMQHVEITAISCETGVVAIRCATCRMTTIIGHAALPPHADPHADLWHVSIECPAHSCGVAGMIKCFAVKGAA
jgi:hypothetical protein